MNWWGRSAEQHKRGRSRSAVTSGRISAADSGAAAEQVADFFEEPLESPAAWAGHWALRG